MDDAFTKAPGPPLSASLHLGPLTSLSENLCFWELELQAETGSAVEGQNKRGYNLQGK